jgi:hypothetical protein
VLLLEVWGHDALRGLNIEDSSGPASALVRDSLFEANRDDSMFVGAAQVSVERSVFRRTEPGPGDFGRGIELQDNSEGIATVAELRSVVVEDVVGLGLMVAGSIAEVDASVIRRTRASADGTGGHGLNAQGGMANHRASVTLTRSLVTSNVGAGVLVSGADFTMEAGVVSHTEPLPTAGRGRGLSIGDDPATGERGHATIRSSVFDGNYEVGIAVIGAAAEVQAVVVRGTQTVDLAFGRGIQVQYGADGSNPGELDLRNSWVQHQFDIGVMVLGASAVLEQVLVEQTMPRPSDGLDGDGVSLLSMAHPAELTMRESLVRSSARAAISNFGGTARLLASRFDCNGLDLDGEPFEGTAFQFEDQGANICGCGEQPGTCQVVTSELEPPDPLPP